MTSSLLHRRPLAVAQPVPSPAGPEILIETLSTDEGVIQARLDNTGTGPEALLHAAIRFVEAMTAQDDSIRAVRFATDGTSADLLVRHAAARPVENEPAMVELLPGLVWQLPLLWLLNAQQRPYPALRVISNGRGHPLRPPKPAGELYRRHIPWLDRELSFRAAQPSDAALLNGWMNQPRVAAIWDEAGPLEHHAAYIAGLLADPHMLPLIGLLDDVPFGWFEVYYAAENRLGPHYACEDWDRGWHVAIGDENCRGAAYVSAWLPSLMHFMFLDEPRTQRIVGEPRADHRQQIKNLERSGFATIGTVDFAHKRAALVMLTRERFFRDRLWAPGAVETSLVGTPRPL